jgi:methionyl-tRNA formyltransferase
LARLQAGACPQPDAGVTYAEKIRKEEAVVNWHRPAPDLARGLRAFTPFPGLASPLQGEMLKFWRAEAVAGSGLPGTVLAVDAAGVRVACGEGALQITELQKPGGKRLPAADFLAGRPIVPGQCFDV